jgi:hypothetical protein
VAEIDNTGIAMPRLEGSAWGEAPHITPPSMSDSLEEVAAVTAGDGAFYVIAGGRLASINTAPVYRLDSGAWSALPPAPLADNGTSRAGNVYLARAGSTGIVSGTVTFSQNLAFGSWNGSAWDLIDQPTLGGESLTFAYESDALKSDSTGKVRALLQGKNGNADKLTVGSLTGTSWSVAAPLTQPIRSGGVVALAGFAIDQANQVWVGWVEGGMTTGVRAATVVVARQN